MTQHPCAFPTSRSSHAVPSKKWKGRSPLRAIAFCAATILIVSTSASAGRHHPPLQPPNKGNDMTPALAAPILTALGIAALSLSAAAQSYTVTALEPSPGAEAESVALGIDDHGWVSGQSRPDGLAYHLAVVWAGNVHLELTGSGISGAGALAIADGTAVGYSDTLDLNAFAWAEGQLTPLATDVPCCSLGADVSRRGWVVGRAFFGSHGLPRAALWRGGALTDLGTLGGGTSDAYGVNEAGQVVGSASLPSGFYHPFLWQDGAMVDLGTLGGTVGEARDLNEAGHVVGDSSDAGGHTKAFLHDDNGMHNLGALPGGLFSYAHAINDAGQVVGGSYSGTESGLRGTLWENRVPTDLNDLIPPNTSWVLGEAKDINELGEIVGTGTFEGRPRGYKLTPAGLRRLILAPPVPGIAGQTWHFQLWYRDANPGPTSNLTESITLTLR